MAYGIAKAMGLIRSSTFSASCLAMPMSGKKRGGQPPRFVSGHAVKAVPSQNHL